MACSASADLFSVATSGVGYCAVIFAVALGFGYSAWRMVCCCSRKQKNADAALPGTRRRGPCDVPLHLHPAVALFGSLRAASHSGGASELRVGDGVRVACYQREGRDAVRAIELRLVPAGGVSVSGPSYLDPPAPAGAWSAALSERVHAGIFRICSANGGCFTLAAADDARRMLQRREDAVVPAGWTDIFTATMLTAAAARDAPICARGFAGRPMRRIAVALALEGLGAFACATVEVTTASAQLQALCRPWWARALTRGVATAVILSTVEYTCTVIAPISVERLSNSVFVKGGAALTIVLSAFALWGLIVQAAAAALGSAILVWLCALLISHVIMWPALLLLSAGVWRDAPLLPDETTGAPHYAAVYPPTLPPPKPGRWSAAGSSSGSDPAGSPRAAAIIAIASSPPEPLPVAHDDNPFAGPAAETWHAPPPHGAW